MCRYVWEKPLQEVLTLDVLNEIFEHQKVLDATFLEVANRPPSLQDRENLLWDEVAEFVKEFKKENKYFTNKENNLDAIIDEHSDILHFYVGHYIAELIGTTKDMADLAYMRIKRHYDEMVCDNPQTFTERRTREGIVLHDIIHYLTELRGTNDMDKQVAIATILIGMLGFTAQDVLVQYRKKRDVNYARIERTRKGVADR